MDLFDILFDKVHYYNYYYFYHSSTDSQALKMLKTKNEMSRRLEIAHSHDESALDSDSIE